MRTIRCFEHVFEKDMRLLWYLWNKEHLLKTLIFQSLQPVFPCMVETYKDKESCLFFLNLLRNYERLCQD